MNPGLVPMLAPDGTPGYVPQERLQDALAAGGKQGVGVLAPDGTRGVVPQERVQDALRAGGKLIGAPIAPPQVNMQAAGPVARFAEAAIPAAGEGLLHAGPQMATGQRPEDVLPSFQKDWVSLKGLVGSVANPIKRMFGGDIAGGAGELAGQVPAAVLQGTLYGPAGEESLAGSAAAVRRGIAGDLNKPRGTIPAQSYTAAELIDYARENKIPVTAEHVTGAPLLRGARAVGEQALIGGSKLKAVNEAAQQAVGQHAIKLMQESSPETSDAMSQGAAIRQSVEDALQREQLKAREEYAAVDMAAKGAAVDMTPVKQTAAAILNDSAFVRDVSKALDAPKAAQALKGVADGPAAATFSQAQQLRSALLDLSRSPELAVATRAQGWIKRIDGALDSTMMDASEKFPGLKPQFRLANEHWEQLQNDFNRASSPLAQVLKADDPSRIPQLFTQKGQTGGSPWRAGLLDEYGIDKGPIKQAIQQDVASQNFGLHNNGSLAGYNHGFLQSVFSPEELDSLYKTGVLARSVKFDANPSGSGKLALMGAQIAVPPLGAKMSGVAYSAASPAVNRWLMQTGKPATAGPGSRVPLSLLLRVNQRRDDD